MLPNFVALLLLLLLLTVNGPGLASWWPQYRVALSSWPLPQLAVWHGALHQAAMVRMFVHTMHGHAPFEWHRASH